MAAINVGLWIHVSVEQGVCLLPDLEDITVRVDLAYDGSGRLDFDTLLDSLERGCQEQWGLRPSLVAEARHDAGFMSQLKQAIIETDIQVNSNILEKFDFYPKGLAGEMVTCHIPVKMQGSGMSVSIWACAENGGYDLDGLVNDLEDSYREMLFLPAGYKVFSDSQRSAIRADGTKWIEKLKGEYRNHLADKLGYSKEQEYRYKEIKSYKFSRGSIVFMEGKTVNATFSLSGTIVIRKNKLYMDVMGETALLGPPGVVAWNGKITLLKNGNPVAAKGIQGTNAGVWPNEGGRVPVGAIEFQLEPPRPQDKWQLKFNVGYFYQEYGSGGPAMTRATQAITIKTKKVKFPDAIWKIDRDYEWLNPL